MVIRISNTLKSKLPEQERNLDVENRLLEKSGGDCFLCGGVLKPESEDIEADHNDPEAEGGDTTLDNLNLAHSYCNRFKRNHPTANVKPFLRLQKLIHQHGGHVKYDKALDLLGHKPKSIGLKIYESSVEVRRSGESDFKAFPLFTEQVNDAQSFRCAFVELGPLDLFNDKNVQPRNIREKHVWAIYKDLNMNPLHEPPGCRIERKGRSGSTYDVLLFDGQHKAIASWIGNKDSVPVKLYLDFEEEDAVRLVNSIQSKIKKLPLSPFEVAAKMAQEWQDRFEVYREKHDDQTSSESHFFQWVESDQRSRAKQAFQDALYQVVIDEEGLEMRAMISSPGSSLAQTESPTITENAFKMKLLKPLVHLLPFSHTLQKCTELRSREKTNIVEILNIFFAKAFAPAMKADAEELDQRVGKQMSYQASLSYVSGLLKGIVNHRVVANEPASAFLARNLEGDLLQLIAGDIERLCAHPIWRAPGDSGKPKVVAVREALSKNQDAKGAFEAVHLTMGYCLGVDSPDNCLD